jgi:sugar (pentulose or hexulose) kinase
VADLARAVFESVAWEVERCLEAICARQPRGPGVTRLALTGAGASTPVWREVLTAVTGLPARCRRSGQAASMGAAMLAAAAVGVEMSLDVVDPVDVDVEPILSMTLDYSARRQQGDRVASSLIDLARASTGAPSARSVETGDPTCG